MRKQILLIALLFGIASYSQGKLIKIEDADSIYVNGNLISYRDIELRPSFEHYQFRIKNQEELDAEFLEHQKLFALNLMDKFFEEEILIVLFTRENAEEVKIIEPKTFETFYKWLKSK